MLSIWSVSAIVLLYLAGLFALAFWGDKKIDKHQQHPFLYSLGLGVHCTSWAFFGTTTQTTHYGWPVFPTYVGIALVMLFAFPVLIKITRICQQNSVSSLADFISLRYGRSHSLAALITLLCFVGVVPYIALQLDAITESINLLTADADSGSGTVGLYVAALMALFAILFGTQTLSLTEKHPGLLVTIATESVIKLLGLCVVGIYVCYGLFDGVFDLVAQAAQQPSGRDILYADKSWSVYISHILLGICAMFVLPRQFHMNFVENNGTGELATARWLFPLYLLGMTLFLLPIALAGSVLLDPATARSDSLVLAIPLHEENLTVSVIAFLGGLSATTSMIIVATLALGIMIANNLITPLWFKFKLKKRTRHTMEASQLLNIRRLTVLVVLSVAFWYHINVSQSAPLVKSGIIAMALLSQMLPTMMFSLYWQKSSKAAAISGMLAGFIGWVTWMLYPSLLSSYYFNPIPTDAELATSYVLSLLINCGVYVLVAALLSPRNSASPDVSDLASTPQDEPELAIPVNDLLSLTERVLEPAAHIRLAKQLTTTESANSRQGYASQGLLTRVEKLMAGQIGHPSARLLLTAIADSKGRGFSHLVHWVEEASQSFQFNHEVLMSSVQHIQQGIVVLDQNLDMLAWNDRYIEMFSYPAGILKVGKPIKDILQYNAHRGLLGEVGNMQEEINKRVHFMAAGSQYKYVRKQADGRVIELNGSPLPGGGYVTTYSDITEYIRIQDELEQAKTELEARVAHRTKQLELAKQEADQANLSKTKFLAAAGHDLMQPFNAATLFASMLVQKTTGSELQTMSEGLLHSLNSAESLLTSLLDMTRLESGRLTVQKTHFALDDVLSGLVNEFKIIGEQKALKLRYCPTSVNVYSDPKLLRRIIQNLLSNAVRYTHHGAVLIGVRHRQNQKVEIAVIDTGPGIPEHQLQEIFNEFHQLDQQHNQGLGLGLTIVERISQLLVHPVSVASQPGKGTTFTISVERSFETLQRLTELTGDKRTDPQRLLDGKQVLVIENDEQISAAMVTLLSDWGASVTVAKSCAEALAHQSMPDLLMVDYHLDYGETGIQVVEALRTHWQQAIPGVLNTANRHDGVRDEARTAGLLYLPKPLKPAALKRLLKQHKLVSL
ncbi:PAS domain-containing hybrid sensor histidine kinase/response regulator [Alteromonas lipolytica]|uniref:histidine kinase n=1 Tax=Alteromonas lipolytica TaxID=1856405 RepID=A0A1E8FEH7_9ALTE|nr:PAS domain-containing hybrid sensor histidine kinase/response regulator [Alteromonas lipolytica]OFI34319.1 hybrid sensor histidine kinase/response regulator [Alteromonas lipolytica]GGF82497.1 two-component sensor [Alteromonas lipolytica]